MYKFLTNSSKEIVASKHGKESKKRERKLPFILVTIHRSHSEHRNCGPHVVIFCSRITQLL